MGRASNNDLVLAVEGLSKFHAYFTQDGENWAVTDYRSATGTELNHRPLESQVPHALRDGDTLRFGRQVEGVFLTTSALYARLRG